MLTLNVTATCVIDQDLQQTANPTFGNLTITSFAANWTNAGRTVADLGIITTVDINGGTIDATAIGASTPAAITGTTVDATTDFTVGGLVITDGNIADTGVLVVVPTTSMDVRGSGFVYIGEEDVNEGVLTLRGNITGNNDGGYVAFETAEDFDTTITAFVIQAFQDDLWIGPSTDLNSIEYTGADNTWNFNEDVTFAGCND